jgi:mevalonate kinase
MDDSSAVDRRAALNAAVQMHDGIEDKHTAFNSVLDVANAYHDWLKGGSAVENEILAIVRDIQEKVGIIMTSQNDIDAAVTTFTTLLTDIQDQTGTLVTDMTEIQQELSAAGVDTSKLDAVVTNVKAIDTALDTAVSQVSGLVPPAATPPTQ